jgi:hypothetical protein
MPLVIGESMKLASICLALAVATPAWAGWPDDVMLDGIDTWRGSAVVDQDLVTADYHQVLRELGTAISNKPMHGGETLGIYGFEVGLSNTIAFVDTRAESGLPSPWARVHQDGEPNNMMVIPRLDIRKGLPASIEVGASMGYLAISRQTSMGGYLRAAPLEGYRNMPDVVLQVGYAGYVGNDQLELGTMDVSGTVGYTIPFGRVTGVNNARIAPYLGFGGLKVHARPNLPEEEQASLGIGAVSGFKNSEDFDDSFALWQIHGGFRITSGSFSFRGAGTWVPGGIGTVNVGMGFVY